MLARFAMVLLACCVPASAWTESIEFPWNSFPRHLWERELVWMKNIGIRHVSLPAGADNTQLSEVIAIVRRLGIEADLDGPIPPAYEALSKRHGGPLTEPVIGAATLSLLDSKALLKSRELLLSGAPGVIWTHVEDTLGASGYAAGAVSFSGQERPATAALRRSAQLSLFWSEALAGMEELPGAGTRLPAEAVAVKQYAAQNGTSLVSVVNTSSKPWTGDIKATYTAIHRLIVLPNVTVPANDAVWLPIGIPLTASTLCRDCNAFAPSDHLVYSTAEVSALEYENGILAIEFASPGKAEVVLQLSHEPSGPLVAGGKPGDLDWDEKTLRARLSVPANVIAPHRVRIGLAIEAPDATAFFDSARVLLIGEKNRLKAQFSSPAVAQRSRLRVAPAFPSAQSDGKQPLEAVYDIDVPAGAVHGDRAELALEADGTRLSHAQPQLLRAATLRFSDAIAVRVGPNSSLMLHPAVIPVNARAGRDFTITLRNNAAEIRSFEVTVAAPGFEFSPDQRVTVGASDARELTFRVFPTAASAGLHSGEVKVTGAANAVEPLRFLTVPQTGSVAWASNGFSFLESTKIRASFLQSRWLEYLNKDSGSDALPAGGIHWDRTPATTLPELEPLLPAQKR